MAHDACLIDKKSKTSARCLDHNPWISVGLAKSSNVKNILYKRWIRSKGTSLEESKGISVEETRYNEYRDYRSKLRDLIKASKTNYYMQLFEMSRYTGYNPCKDSLVLGINPIHIRYTVQTIYFHSIYYTIY